MKVTISYSQHGKFPKSEELCGVAIPSTGSSIEGPESQGGGRVSRGEHVTWTGLFPSLSEPCRMAS